MRVDPYVTGAASFTLWLLQVALLASGGLVAIAEFAPPGQTMAVWDQLGAGIISCGNLAPFALVVALLAAPSMPEADDLGGASRNRTLRHQSATLAALVGYGVSLILLLGRWPGPSSIVVPLAVVTATAGLLALALATRGMLVTLAELPTAVARRSVALVAGTMAVGLVAKALANTSISVTVLERTTLRLVEAVLHGIYADVVSDLAHRRVGTSGFTVRVETGCSGIEGIALGIALAGFYLGLARHRLRFPRAALLVPVVALAVAAMNIVRIVLLIVVGQRWPALAIGGFHSGIGWFLFAATIATGIPAVERLFRLHPGGLTQPDARSDPSQPFLLPLLVSLAVSLVITMVGLHDTPWALLRYGAAVAVVMLTWQTLPDLTIPRRPLPWVAGALLTVPWVVSSAGAQGAAAFMDADPHWVVLRVAGFVLVTPLIEEIGFRGYLMRRLDSARFLAVRLRDTSWRAVVLSSVIFGAMHGMWAEAMIAGLVFALVARRFDAIGPAVAAHACTNAILVMYSLATGDFGVIG